MQRIRVAFFAEVLVKDMDGACRTMFQLIERIHPAVFEFLFICSIGPETLQGFECVRIPAITLPVNATYKMGLPRLAQHSLYARLRAFNPQVIHIATPSLLGNFAIRYAQKQQIPVLSIYHTHFISYIDYYLKHIPFLIHSVKHAIATGQRSFYNQCHLVYVPSEAMRTALIEMGVQPRNLKFWKRGIDNTLFSPQKRNLAWMQQLTGNEHPVILFASRLVWEKNLETLFGVYDLLDKLGMPVNLVIAGDGIARKACERRMPAAVFMGKTDHQTLSVLYASADVFLFPSVSETYGNVVLEAMASGLPCVIARGGGSKSLVTHGVNGFTCDPYRAGDYIEKIRYLLQHKAFLWQFRKTGLQQEKQHSWQELADTYFNDLLFLSGKQPQIAIIKPLVHEAI